MLVLAPQRDESAVIGDQIEVTVIDIRGEKLRSDIGVPRDIPVHRKEVYLSIQRQRTQSDIKGERRPRPSSNPWCPHVPNERWGHPLTRIEN